MPVLANAAWQCQQYLPLCVCVCVCVCVCGVSPGPIMACLSAQLIYRTVHHAPGRLRRVKGVAVGHHPLPVYLAL